MNQLPSFDNAISEELTANDNSIGSSGGTTDVRISVHSKNSLYLLRFGSAEPKDHKENKNIKC